MFYLVSGGPLFTKKNGQWVQLGLVSWGPNEITSTSYDVNTDVLYFKDWIVTHKNRSDCHVRLHLNHVSNSNK